LPSRTSAREQELFVALRARVAAHTGRLQRSAEVLARLDVLAALAELAAARYQREDFCAPDDVVPMYLRKSDAELAWDRKGG